MTDPTPQDGPSQRTVVLLQVGVGLLAALLLAVPVIATHAGVTDGALVNADEAVAALLPVEFARGAPVLVFPGNAYQGVIETPVYAAAWALGSDLVLLRVLHQAVWLAAMASWAAVAVEALRRTRVVPRAALWWAVLAVFGLLGVTSAFGWQAWFRVYPGYQLGALLAAAAVWTALRQGRHDEQRRWRWVLAGLLAGTAGYAQPMHAGAMVAVLAVAAVAAPHARRGAVVRVCVGAAIGLAPLVLWNLRNGMATFDGGRQPVVQHPEWGYPERVLGLVRTTWRVLWGGSQVPSSGWMVAASVICATAVLAIGAAGVVALVRSGRAGVILVVLAALLLLGLPVLRVMSLEAEPRYAVGWWPALIVLVAAGTAALAGAAHREVRRGVAGVVGVAVVLQLAVAVAGAATVVRSESQGPEPVAATRDLAEALRRCGVDALWGDYWSLYPAVWASHASLRATVNWGPQRLTSVLPDTPDGPRRAAVVLLPELEDVSTSADLVVEGTGRGVDGWFAVVHPPTGTRIAIERTGTAIPQGCVGADLRPL